MGVAKLGHVGIHCDDIAVQRNFYRDVIGLTVTDEDPAFGMVFLSARPADEHHELVLCAGRTAPPGTLLVQQISFRCDALDDVLEFYERFKRHGVRFDRVVTHGNAIGIYVYDPEGNRCEVYWPTDLPARQPFIDAIDLERPRAEILERVQHLVEKYGTTGYIDPGMLETQDIRTAASDG